MIHKSHHERIAYVLQGGGALGSYQVGACRALMEAGYHPDWIVGVSIGAINAAIIAGNAPEDRLKQLERFWQIVGSSEWWFGLGQDVRAHYKAFHDWWNGQLTALFGQHGFFNPNYLNPALWFAAQVNELSYYNVSALQQTLESLIDFERINHGKNKIVFSVGAVNVKTGRMKYFNNIHHKIGIEHILASGALAPAFPAVEIDGEYYWDGGLHSNTPLTVILEAKAPKNTLCFMIDLFSAAGELPKNFLEIESRKKDIGYSSHAQHTTVFYSLCQNLRSTIHTLAQHLPEKIKQDPEIAKLIALGHPKVLDIVRIVYHDCDDNLGSKDYNFSPPVLTKHQHNGYRDAKAILSQSTWANGHQAQQVGAFVHGNVAPIHLAKEDIVSLDDR